jgi:hypothetical protein
MRIHSLFTVCLLLFSLSTATAQVIVSPTIIQGNTSYTYDYQLTKPESWVERHSFLST